MLTAIVTTVHSATTSRGSRALARCTALIGPDNPRGQLLIPLEPPYWTDGRRPRVGMEIMFGAVERPAIGGNSSGWLASDACPAFVIEGYSRRRLREPTMLRTPCVARTRWERLLQAVGVLPTEAVEFVEEVEAAHVDAAPMMRQLA